MQPWHARLCLFYTLTPDDFKGRLLHLSALSHEFVCFYSKVLYELYKSIKKSKQDVGIEQDGLFNHTSFLKELVKQACDISGVPGIIVGDRLLQVFKTKLSALIEAVRKETAKGGGPVRRLLARWTTGRYSTWKFKIFYSEL